MSRIQTSESLQLGMLLSLAGGFMDAYSYLCRGGVFANAETGNVVLFALNIASCHWKQAALYFIPILAFASGVWISDSIKARQNHICTLHWRQMAISIEVLALIAVAFLPQRLNILANSMISLTCGIQVTAFSKFRSKAMATTMCTGNLRVGTQSLLQYRRTGNRQFLSQGCQYYGGITCFILGAMLGSACVGPMGEPAILIAAGLLLIALLSMFLESLEDHSEAP